MCVTLTNVVMPGGWLQVRPDNHPQPGQLFSEYLYCDGGFAQASSLMVTRDLLQSVRFCEDLRQYEDHLFYMALAAAGATYLVVEAPLTTRDNRPGADRLSQGGDLASGAVFIRVAGPMLSERARLAFGVRILGPRRLQREPMRAVRDAAKAVTSGAVGLSAVGAMVMNGLAPSAVRDKAVRWAAR